MLKWIYLRFLELVEPNEKMKKREQPNILFIFTDQQSATMMSCSGNPYLHTPAMDSLAQKGMRFERAYCTNPVCIPSRFSLMTGHMPSDIGLRCNDTSSIPSLPEHILHTGLGHLLKEAGYHTAFGGKEHLPKTNAEQLGFTFIEKDERDGLARSCERFIKNPPAQPWALTASFINPHDICYMAIRAFAEDNLSKQLLLQHGKTEIETLEKALNMPSEFPCPPIPQNHAPQENEPAAVGYLRKQRPFRKWVSEHWSEDMWRKHRWAYARLTELVDAQILRVLDALEESGQAKNTVVVFTSDHGDHDSSHLLEHKTALYDEACRVPLIMVWDDSIPAGSVCPQVVSNGLDILPTLCEIAGRSVPKELEGHSLLPLLTGRGKDHRDREEYVPVESEFGSALWSPDYAYVRYDMLGNAEQLYDLQNDPGQMRNALFDPQNEGIVKHFREVFG